MFSISNFEVTKFSEMPRIIIPLNTFQKLFNQENKKIVSYEKGDFLPCYLSLFEFIFFPNKFAGAETVLYRATSHLLL